MIVVQNHTWAIGSFAPALPPFVEVIALDAQDVTDATRLRASEKDTYALAYAFPGEYVTAFDAKLLFSLDDGETWHVWQLFDEGNLRHEWEHRDTRLVFRFELTAITLDGEAPVVAEGEEFRHGVRLIVRSV